MKDLNELERSLLEAARRGFEPSLAVGARIRGRALSAVAAGTLVACPAASLPERAKNGALDALDALQSRAAQARVLLGVLTLSGVGMGGYALGLHAGRAEAQAGRGAVKTPSALPAPPLAVVVPAPEPERLAADAERPPPPAHTHPTLEHAVTAAGTESPADPEEELRALRRIEHVLREHNPRLAAALLDELDRSVPHGKLVEERNAARSIAACGLDDAASVANSRAAEFAARYPGSVYLPRVKQACALGDGAAERIETSPETDRKQ
jgi:hypothetical protein